MKPWVTWADLLTALRVPLAVAFPFVHHPGWQLGLVGAAAASDFFDGMLARRFGSSRAGAILDPVADKLFMAAAFVTVAGRRLLHPMEIVAVLARDIVAVLGSLGGWLLRRPVALPARAGGKAVTVLQLLTLAAVVTDSPYARRLAWATAAVGLYAIWDYGRVATRGGRLRSSIRRRCGAGKIAGRGWGCSASACAAGSISAARSSYSGPRLTRGIW